MTVVLCFGIGPPMKSTLVAKVVTSGSLEHGVEHVGWSADGAGGDHLIVMRNFDDDDDGYCLLANDATYYGGVETLEVSEGETRVVVSDAAAAALGTATEIVIRYPAESATADQLRTLLTRLIST